MDWLLLYYCWVGVHHKGGNLKTLSGGRWTSWKSLATAVGIAGAFWVLWEGAEYGVYWLLGSSSAKTVDSLLPKSLVEILIWIATSITAGICEEMAFRGYLQKQFHALAGSVAMAVLAQGLVFGLFHAYQGWKNVIVISVLGVLYGILAAWRKFAGERHCACLGRRLVRMVEVRGLEVGTENSLLVSMHYIPPESRANRKLLLTDRCGNGDYHSQTVVWSLTPHRFVGPFETEGWQQGFRSRPVKSEST